MSEGTRFPRIIGLNLIASAALTASCAAPVDPAPDEPLGEALSAVSTCISIQRGAFGSVEDAHIADDKPTKNWAASNSLTAGDVPPGLRHALLQFDTSAIPSGSTVTSATVVLDVLLQLGSAAPVRAHRVTAPWNEATVTWNSFAGAYQSPVEATFPAGSPTSASITSLARGWVSGSVANHGLLLERDLTGATVFSSSEDPTVSVRPRLDVCYDAAVVPSNCHAGSYGGHDYLICKGSSTVPEASAFCANVGMGLAFIDDLAENKWVVDTALAAHGYVDFFQTSYWIANTKVNSPILPWAAGEPNNSADQCIHVLRYPNQPYLWNDAGCTQWHWGWVCESG